MNDYEQYSHVTAKTLRRMFQLASASVNATLIWVLFMPRAKKAALAVCWL